MKIWIVPELVVVPGEQDINSLIFRAIGTLPVMHYLLTEAYPTEIRTQARTS